MKKIKKISLYVISVLAALCVALGAFFALNSATTFDENGNGTGGLVTAEAATALNSPVANSRDANPTAVSNFAGLYVAIELNSVNEKPRSIILSNDIVIYSALTMTGASKDVTLDLNGHMLYLMDENAPVITVTAGTLTIKDSNIRTQHYYNYSNRITNFYNGTTKYNASTGTSGYVLGGVIAGGKGYVDGSNRYGGGIYVSGGTVNIMGGTIAGNVVSGSINGFGGGIGINGGTVNMSGGTITCNDTSAVARGGGVGIKSGTFNMTGGTIALNGAAGQWGGGIYQCGGTVNISGGEICRNTGATFGGGIMLASGNMYINDGAYIHDNTATTQGGGVFVVKDSAFNAPSLYLYGGKITANTAPTGAGIGSIANTTIHLKGSPIVKDNLTAAKVQNNILFSSSTPVMVLDGLLENAELYIYPSGYSTTSLDTLKTNNGGQFTLTSGYNTTQLDNISQYIQPSEFFFMDNSGYSIVRNSAGEVAMVQTSNSKAVVHLYTNGSSAIYETFASGLAAYNACSWSGTAANRPVLTLLQDYKIADRTNIVVTQLDGVINLNGHILRGNGTATAPNVSSIISGAVLEVGNSQKGSLTITIIDTDKTTKHYYTVDSSTGMYSFYDSSNNAYTSGNYISGGVITGGLGSPYELGTTPPTRGGGIIIQNNSTLNLYGGTIAGNKATEGGGVYLFDNCRLNMRNADIVGNYATSTGGGLHAQCNAIIENSHIDNNKATTGGGIYTYEKTAYVALILSDTTIRNNTATNGGGIYLYEGNLYLDGGVEITGNKATSNYGGVYYNWYSEEDKHRVHIAGLDTITGNTAGSTVSNLTLNDHIYIVFEGEVDPATRIGISRAGGYTERTLTIGYSTASYKLLSNPDNYFFLDTSNGGPGEYKVNKNTSGEAVISKEDIVASVTIGTTVTNYSTIVSAITAYNGAGTSDNPTLTLLANVTTTTFYHFTKTGTVDLNGFVWRLNGSGVALGANAVTVTLKDSNPSTKHYYKVDSATGKYLYYNGDNLLTATDTSTYTSGGLITGGTGGPAGGKEYGGAWFICFRGSLIMDGGVLAGNTAYDGGAVYTKVGTFTMNGGSIVGNYAVDCGGAYYGTGDSNTNIVINNGTIENNRAANGGGALYILKGSNTNVTIANGTIANNTAAYGGGIYTVAPITISGGTISGNTATASTDGSSTAGGGALLIGGTGSAVSTVTMTGGTISGNTTKSWGGAVLLANLGAFTLNGGTISGNTAVKGGAVAIVSTATLTLNGGDIKENTASTYGGGIFAAATGANIVMTAGNIDANEGTSGSSIYGGGVYLLYGTMTMSGGVISNNEASYAGGVWISNNTTFKMTGGSVFGNNAVTSYGGIYDGGTLTMGDSPFVLSNTVGGSTQNNVTLDSNKVINISSTESEKLVDGRSSDMINKGEYSPTVGITLTTYPSRADRVLTSGYSSQNQALVPYIVFTMDDSTSYDNCLSIFVNELNINGEAYLKAAIATLTSSNTGNKEVGYTNVNDFMTSYNSDADTNKVLKLYENIAITDQLTFTSSGTLDLNDKVLEQKTDGKRVMEVKCTLTIIDSATTKTTKGVNTTESGTTTVTLNNSETLKLYEFMVAKTSTVTGQTYYEAGPTGFRGAYKGGYITGGSVSDGYGGAILVTSGKLNLQGGTIACNYAMYGGAIAVNVNNGLAISNGANIICNAATRDGGSIWTKDGVAITITNSTLAESYAGGNGGVIYSGGNTTISQSNISGLSKNTVNGGAIYVKAGTVTLNDDGTGSVRTAVSGYAYGGNGGAIYLAGGVVSINGSTTITGTAYGYGGSIYVASGGNGKLYDGTIKGGQASAGGNVYVASGGAFNMVGGTITGGKAVTTFNLSGVDSAAKGYGGGMYLLGTFNVSAGSITGNAAANHGCGIADYGKLNVWGSFTCTNNSNVTSGSHADQVYLGTVSTVITIGSQFTSGASIGVEPCEYTEAAITSGYKNKNTSGDGSQFFVSPSGDYEVYLSTVGTTNGEIVLAHTTHTYSYVRDDSTRAYGGQRIYQKCSRADGYCTYITADSSTSRVTGSLKMVGPGAQAPADSTITGYPYAINDYVATYDGTSKEASYTTTGLMSGKTYTITYSGTSNGDLTTAPAAASTDFYNATAVITDDKGNEVGLTAAVRYMIIPKSVSVTGATVSGKVYDGTTAATVTSITLNGVIAADTNNVVATGTGNFVDKNVGTNKNVEITDIQLTGTAATNYMLDGTSYTAAGAAAITRAPLTANIGSTSVVYGSELPTSQIGVTYVGLKGSDTASDINSNGLILTSDYSAGSNVGKYYVKGSGLSSDNYTISYTDGVLTVTKREIAVSTVQLEAVTFNDDDEYKSFNLLGATFTNVFGDDELTLIAATMSALESAFVTGYVTVSVKLKDLSLGGAKASNYTLTTTEFDGTANVTPKVLTLDITPTNGVYGQKDGKFVISGLEGVHSDEYTITLNGQVIKLADGSYEYTVTNDNSAGEYTLYIEETNEDTHYTFGGTTTATLEIERQVIASPSNIVVTYDKNAHSITEGANANLALWNIAGMTGADTASHTDAGTYRSTISIENTDYKFEDGSTEVTVALYIAQATASIQLTVGQANQAMFNEAEIATPTTKVVDSNGNVLSGIDVSLYYKKEGEEDTASTTTKPINAGSYVVSAIATDPNYLITGAQQPLTIHKAEFAVALSAETVTTSSGQDAQTLVIKVYNAAASAQPVAETDYTLTINVKGSNDSTYSFTSLSDFNKAMTSAQSSLEGGVTYSITIDVVPKTEHYTTNYVTTTKNVNVDKSKTSTAITFESTGGGIYGYARAPIAYVQSQNYNASANTGIKLYSNAENPQVTFTYQNVLGGDPTTEIPTAVGTYTVTATYAGDSTYAASQATAQMSISKGTPVLSLTIEAITYGGTPDPKATLTYYNEEVADAAITYTYGSTQINYASTANEVSSWNVGTYYVRATFAGNDNLEGASSQASFVIAPSTITVAINNATSEYGDDIAELTATHTGSVKSGETAYTLSTVATSTSSVGQYEIVANRTSNNYNVVYKDNTKGVYTITAKSVTVNWPTDELVYNGSQQKPTVVNATYTKNGTANGGTLAGNLFNVTYSGDNVNAGKFTATAVLKATNSNYNLTNTTKQFTIAPMKIDVVADNVSSQYGTILPLTAKAYKTGTTTLVTLSDITNAYALSTTATATSTIGDYDITVANGTSGNYTIVNKTNAKYTITARLAGSDSIEWGTTTFTYNGQDQSGSIDVKFFVDSTNYVALKVSSITSGGQTATFKNAGNYKIEVTFASEADAQKYALPDNASYMFTIEKAPLVVKANDKSITYKQNVTDTGYTIVSGLVGDDVNNSANVLSGVALYEYYKEEDNGQHTAYTINSDTGNYVIAVSNLTSNNYNIEYQTGTLTVVKKILSVVWIPVEDKEYDGTNTAHFLFGESTSMLNNDGSKASIITSASIVNSDYQGMAGDLLNYEEVVAYFDTQIEGKSSTWQGASGSTDDVTVEEEVEQTYDVGTYTVKFVMPEDLDKILTEAARKNYTFYKIDENGNHILDIDQEAEKKILHYDNAGIQDAEASIIAKDISKKDSINEIVIAVDSSIVKPSNTASSTPAQANSGTQVQDVADTTNVTVGENNVLQVDDSPLQVYYTGNAITLDIKKLDVNLVNNVTSSKDSIATLVEDKDYTVTYRNNTDVNDAAEVIITGIGNYTGGVTYTFSIVKSPTTLEGLTATSIVYSNGEVTHTTPVLKLVSNGSVVELGENDIIYTYWQGDTQLSNKPTEVGNYVLKAKVEPTDEYEGAEATCEFTISKADLGNSEVTGVPNAVIYNGAEYKFDDLVVTLYDNTVDSSDYTISYANNKTIGTATITITAKDNSANYTGTKTVEFTISASTLSVEIDETADYQYNPTGAGVMPQVKFYVMVETTNDSGDTVTEKKYVELDPSEYTLTISKDDKEVTKPTDPGMYNVTVALKDGSNYTLEENELVYTITPRTLFVLLSTTDMSYGEATGTGVLHTIIEYGDQTYTVSGLNLQLASGQENSNYNGSRMITVYNSEGKKVDLEDDESFKTLPAGNYTAIINLGSNYEATDRRVPATDSSGAELKDSDGNTLYEVTSYVLSAPFAITKNSSATATVVTNDPYGGKYGHVTPIDVYSVTVGSDSDAKKLYDKDASEQVDGDVTITVTYYKVINTVDDDGQPKTIYEYASTNTAPTDVGEYVADINVESNNYSVTYRVDDFKVTKADVTVELDENQNAVYNGEENPAQVIVTDVEGVDEGGKGTVINIKPNDVKDVVKITYYTKEVSGGAETYKKLVDDDGNSIVPTDAGKYYVTLEVISENFNQTNNNGEYIEYNINKAVIDATITVKDITYGQKPSATVTFTKEVIGENNNVTNEQVQLTEGTDYKIVYKDVDGNEVDPNKVNDSGEYKVSIEIINTNYELKNNGGVKTFNIKPKGDNVNVTGQNAESTYGDGTTPSFTVTDPDIKGDDGTSDKEVPVKVTYYKADEEGNPTGDPLDGAPTDAGEYVAVIKPTDDNKNYDFTIKEKVTINPKPINVAITNGTTTYSGNAVEAVLKVTDKDGVEVTDLPEGELIVTYYKTDKDGNKGDKLDGAPTNAGTYKVEVALKEDSNYVIQSGAEHDLIIEKVKIPDDSIKVAGNDGTYGEENGLKVEVPIPDNIAHEEGKDKIETVVEYFDKDGNRIEDENGNPTVPTDAGEYKAKITSGDENYEFEKEVDFTIAKKDVLIEGADNADPTQNGFEIPFGHKGINELEIYYIKVDGTKVNVSDVYMKDGKLDPDFVSITYYYADGTPMTELNAAGDDYKVKIELKETTNFNALTVEAPFKIGKIETTATNDEEFVFNGEPVTPHITVIAGDGESTGDMFGDITDKYTEDHPIVINYYKKDENGGKGDKLDGAPTEAGDYIMEVVVPNLEDYDGSTTDIPFSITKGQNEIVTPLAIEGWTYSQTPNAPTFEAAYGNDSVVYTYTDANGKVVDISGDLPAGTYYVTATVPETKDYAEITSEKVSFVISKLSDNVISSLTIDGWTYGDKPNAPKIEAKYGADTVTYTYKGTTNSGKAYSSNKAPTEAGNYTVTATIPEGTNYNGTSASTQFTVAKAKVPTPTITPSEYGEEINLPEDDRYEFEEPENEDVGKHEIEATLTDPDNYEWEDGEGDKIKVEYEITRPEENNVTTPEIEGWTYGEEPKTPKAESDYGPVKFVYYDEDGNMVTDEDGNPTVPVHAGTYTVEAVVDETSNYPAGKSEGTQFTISKLKVDVPKQDDTVYYYNGEEQSYGVTSNEYYNVTGGERTEVGEQDVTISLIDKDDYEWNDATMEDKTGDIVYEFDIKEREQEESLLWLIIMLAITLACEIWAITVIEKVHRNRMFTVALPVLLLATYPAWQEIVCWVLAAVIVVLALAYIIYRLITWIMYERALTQAYILVDESASETEGDPEECYELDSNAPELELGIEHQLTPAEEQAEQEEVEDAVAQIYDLKLSYKSEANEHFTKPDKAVTLSDTDGLVTGILYGVDYDHGTALVVRYNRSFTARFIQSSERTKQYYEILKNFIMCFSKARSRVSWKYDSIHIGLKIFAKLGIRGKTLCLYLPLNPDDYADSKYKVERTEARMYEDTPCLYRITNARRVKYAMELLRQIAASYESVEGVPSTTSYYLPYENTSKLVQKGSIRAYLVRENYNDFLTRQKRQAERLKEERQKQEAQKPDEQKADDPKD